MLQVFSRPVPGCAAGDRAGVCVTQLDAKAMERGLLCSPGTVPTFSAAIAAVEKVRFYSGALPTKGKVCAQPPRLPCQMVFTYHACTCRASHGHQLPYHADSTAFPCTHACCFTSNVCAQRCCSCGCACFWGWPGRRWRGGRPVHMCVMHKGDRGGCNAQLHVTLGHATVLAEALSFGTPEGAGQDPAQALSSMVARIGNLSLNVRCGTPAALGVTQESQSLFVHVQRSLL